MAEAILTPNVTSLINNVLEINATDLTTKNITEKAALYKQGIRALKVINNDTIVLLGLQDNGSTEWLGSNKPLNNLLDNSDFTNPVNQRGATIVTDGYSIDRWRNWAANSSSITVNNNSISVVGTLLQYVANIKPGSVLTFAYGNESKTVISSNWEINTENNVAYFNIETGTWTWAAVYRGAYTADTLPPYTPKGYAAELAECQRYFVAVSYNNTMLSGNTGDASGVGARIYLPMGTRMRINPTVSAFVVNASYYGGAKNNLTFTPSNVETTYTGLCLYGNLSSAVSSSPTYVDAVYQIRNADLAISADL